MQLAKANNGWMAKSTCFVIGSLSCQCFAFSKKDKPLPTRPTTTFIQENVCVFFFMVL